MNRKIRQLECDLIEVLNASDVPIEAKCLILENLQLKAEKEADKIIRQELSQQPISEQGDLNNAEST